MNSKGQACFVCNSSKGDLEQIGYDEVLGSLWIHKYGDCKKRVRQAVMNAARQNFKPEEGGGKYLFVLAVVCFVFSLIAWTLLRYVSGVGF